MTSGFVVVPGDAESSVALGPVAFGCTMENVFGLLGDLIGGITLTGSLIAYLKLDGRMSSTAWDLPGKNYINIASLLAFFGLSYAFVTSTSRRGHHIYIHHHRVWA